MDDLGSKSNTSNATEQTARKIPLINMDLHHYAYRTIQRFIDEGLLPKTGNTVIHLDAHGDELVPADMNVLTPLRARSARKDMYRDYATEVWMKEAVDDGCLKHVVWVKPPWTMHITDGHKDLENDVTLDVKTLCRSIFEDTQEDYEGFETIFKKYLSEGDPYILDMEFNFFSADSPHACLYYTNSEKYYSNLQELFKIKMPDTNEEEDIQNTVDKRYEQLDGLKKIFDYLQTNRTLPPVNDHPIEMYQKVAEMRDDLLKHYPDDEIKWDSIYEDGNYASDYIIPVHYTKREDITRMIDECFGKLLDILSTPPALITMAVMYDYDRYTPDKDREFITKSLEDFFKKRFNVKIEYLEF